MKSLLRQESQGNGVSVILDGDIIRKCAVHSYGIERLMQEAAGLRWYGERVGRDVIAFSHFAHGYARLDIEKFCGHTPSYKKSLAQNYNNICQVIDHYIQTWPKQATAPVHGDLTLDNVMMTEDGARFYDWEHFTADPHPWGFDALYCLLSALLLPLEKDKMPDKESYTKFIDLLFVLFANGLSADLAEYPLRKVKEIFLSNSHWRSITDRSPHKLLPFLYDELYCDIVDDYITRRIRHRRYAEFKKTISNDS